MIDGKNRYTQSPKYALGKRQSLWIINMIIKKFSTYGKIGCAWGVAAAAFIVVCFIFFQRQIKNTIEAICWQTKRSFGDIHLWYLRRQRRRSQNADLGLFFKSYVT